MSNGFASPPSSGCRSRARSSTRSRPGSSPRVAELWPPPAPEARAATATSSSPSATMRSGARSAPPSRSSECACTRLTRDEPQRRGFTYLDDERRANDHAARPEAPPAWERPASVGRPGAKSTPSTSRRVTPLRCAPLGRPACSSPRRESSPRLQEAHVELDALVAQRHRPAERTNRVRSTRRRSSSSRRWGARAATSSPASAEGTYAAAELPGPLADAYGAGDSFAAGLTFALARGDSVEEALAFAASCGALKP